MPRPKNRKQSPEHIQKRIAAMVLTVAARSDEERARIKAIVKNRKHVDCSGSANANWRGGYESTCSQCGIRVWVKPSQANRKEHLCSRACAAKSLKQYSGELSSNWRGGLVTRQCGICGKDFSIKQAEAKRSAAAYCSKQCAGVGRRTRTVVNCLRCGNGFDVAPNLIATAKYCSRACQWASMRGPEEMRKLNQRMLALIWLVLRKNKGGQTWQSLVGYTLADLKAHLESLFSPGMTWANMGEWHIDHIRPRSSFSFTTPSDPQFLECWCLANLQPLWKLDNLRKGRKLNYRVVAA